MTADFFQRPILNSPYEVPARHWELDDAGQPTNRVVDRRRRAERSRTSGAKKVAQSNHVPASSISSGLFDRPQVGGGDQRRQILEVVVDGASGSPRDQAFERIDRQLADRSHGVILARSSPAWRGGWSPGADKILDRRAFTWRRHDS